MVGGKKCSGKEGEGKRDGLGGTFGWRLEGEDMYGQQEEVRLYSVFRSFSGNKDMADTHSTVPCSCHVIPDYFTEGGFADILCEYCMIDSKYWRGSWIETFVRFFVGK